MSKASERKRKAKAHAATSPDRRVARKLAWKIARDLFTTGGGERAGRLVLLAGPTMFTNPEAYKGGWCEADVVERVAKMLEDGAK